MVEDKHEVSSSGIQANLDLNGLVEPVAVAKLHRDGIKKFLSPIWQQTTQTMLDDSDIIVLLSKTLLDDTKNKFRLNSSKTVVWEVPDEDGVYQLVKANVDKLIGEL